ncbi:MAG: ABC transporter ATP-binding protein [Luteimonas sp.]
MSSEIVIRVRNVSKSFSIFDKPHQRLMQLIAPKRAAAAEDFKALSNVTFDVRRGEAVGIIGRNGSGKSTLLQIVCGTLQPTSGEVHVGGRVAALLELGAGFNPEFTGRENVFLYGSLLGLTRKQVDERLERILAFAEIGEHVDQPVKTYSSGMFVRLAFAIASNSDPEVLIVDEALAVGDIYFQRKCYRRIEELRDGGCTLLLVTHSMDSLVQLCDRGVVLEGGHQVFDGECKAAVGVYMKCLFGQNLGADVDPPTAEEMAEDEAEGLPALAHDDRALLEQGGHRDMFASRPGYNRGETRLGDGRAVLGDFLVSSGLGHGPVVRAREPFSLFVRYAFRENVDRLVFGVQLRTVEGLVVYSYNTFIADNVLYDCTAREVLVAEFRMRCALLPNQYFMTLGVSRFDEGGENITAIDRRVDSVILTVLGDSAHSNGIADLEAKIELSHAGSRVAVGFR